MGNRPSHWARFAGPRCKTVALTRAYRSRAGFADALHTSSVTQNTKGRNLRPSRKGSNGYFNGGGALYSSR